MLHPAHKVGSKRGIFAHISDADVEDWQSSIDIVLRRFVEYPDGKAARREPNHYVTGPGGARDIDLRAFARDDMALHARLLDCDGERLTFAADLPANLDAADAIRVRSVIWTTGFVSDWSWVKVDAFDASDAPGPPCAGSPPSTASACSAFPGCTRGARGASRASPMTRCTSPTTSQRL
jgi:hypothetical protein